MRSWRVRWFPRAGVLLAAAAAAMPLPAQQVPGGVQGETRDKVLERLRLLDPAAQAEALALDTLQPTGPVPAGALQRPGTAAGPRGPVGATGQQSDDPVLQALLGLRGFSVTEYTGSAARFDADSGVVRLTGPARIQRGDQSLSADSSLVYDLERTLLCGYGKPVLAGGDATSPVESGQICYDIDRRRGEALGARTTYQQGTTWIVFGERVYPIGNDRVYSHNAVFTDCELEEPHYHFAARDVKMVRDEILVARDVTLNFGDVPVFWLPFMVQSLKQGRRSGLLTPRFGINDIARNQSNYNRRISNVGFYWAINDFFGAELAMDWFSNNWTALESTLQYKFAQQFLDGGLTLRRFWRADGARELTLSTGNSWQVDERTSVRLDGNYTSSSEFVRRESRDPNELNRSIDSNAGLNRRFDWGRLSLGASRRQFLTDDRVELTLPTFGLNLSPVTFLRAGPSEASWYNNGSWSASLTGRSHLIQMADTLPDRRAQDASVNSSFSLGNLSWSQSASVSEQLRQPKGDLAQDTSDMRANWSTRLSYQQRLIGTTTLTPSLQLRGELVNSPRSGGVNVSAPRRMDFAAALSTSLFGFFPGVGPFSAVRHRFSPTLGYNYSPAAEADSLQRAVFGRAEVREQNRISVGLSQTFEAKLKADEGATQVETVQDSTRPGEPRRLPQARAMTLLSLQTSAVAYDWVQAREDTTGTRWPGIVTGEITNSLTSDLLRGLQLSLTHNLFDNSLDSLGRAVGRDFAPHLSSVNASFSLSGDSWLFRLLGLAGRGVSAVTTQSAARDAARDSLAALEQQKAFGRGDLDLVGRRGSGSAYQPLSGGPWNAALSYTLTRPRHAAGTLRESQMLRAQMSFQPTPGWAVRWNTGYSFTDSEFSDHVLTLNRRMHDWDANFDFVRAQNGNFTFQFRVQLRANPDIKLDYEQRSDPLRPGF